LPFRVGFGGSSVRTRSGSACPAGRTIICAVIGNPPICPFAFPPRNKSQPEPGVWVVSLAPVVVVDDVGPMVSRTRLTNKLENASIFLRKKSRTPKIVSNLRTFKNFSGDQEHEKQTRHDPEGLKDRSALSNASELVEAKNMSWICSFEAHRSSVPHSTAFQKLFITEQL